MIRHVDVTMDQVWGWLSCLQGLCQQKSGGVDRPQWSTFSHVNYSGSLSCTFGSKDTILELEFEGVKKKITMLQASDSPLDLSAEELDLRMRHRIKEENGYLDGKTFTSVSTLSKTVRNS
eukprot:XP_014624940.1 uncharacterized protein LOC102664075 isoform X2 [Glycine max]